MMIASLLLTESLLIASAFAADPILKQVHVVTRHGARFPLTKSAHDLQEGTAGTLTPTGVQQMKDLGNWLKSVYGSSLVPAYDPSTVYLESSAFDRTVVSANALAAGLFPTAQANSVWNVPVFTTQATNDVTIRAYDKCYGFLEELQYLYQRPLWESTELDYKDLLLRLGQIEAFQGYVDEKSGRVPLTEIWNIYDAITVAKTECTEDEQAPSCQALDDPSVRTVLSESDWNMLQFLVRRTESLKYSSRTAGSFVGFNLLQKITNRMARSHSTVSAEQGSAKFYLYSAHYPVLLALLSALGQREGFSDETIPSYASALVLELHQDRVSGEKTFHARYRVGDPVSGNATRHMLHTLDLCNDLCPFQDLTQITHGWTGERWCEMCGNEDADICRGGSTQNCNELANSEGAVGVVLGLLFGAIGVLVVLKCCCQPSPEGTSIPKSEHRVQTMVSEEPVAAEPGAPELPLEEDEVGEGTMA